MATSKCGACASTLFEIKEVGPTGAKYKHIFVQCQNCGVPIGVIEYQNTAKLIQEMKKSLLEGQRALHAEHQDILTRVRNLERSR